MSEMRVPIPAHSVAVHCDEETAAVEVKQDFLGNDLSHDPVSSSITLMLELSQLKHHF